MKAADALTEEEYDEKENDFERYVVKHFNQKFYTILHWSPAIRRTRKHDKLVESDMSPDLIIRHNFSHEIFCVECKFRSAQKEDELIWSNPKQLKCYQEYTLKHRHPFFIVIGLGGNPSHPKWMFCIPLKEARSPALLPNVFVHLERNPSENFLWANGVLN
jgi:hypothetical protein